MWLGVSFLCLSFDTYLVVHPCASIRFAMASEVIYDEEWTGEETLPVWEKLRLECGISSVIKSIGSTHR